MALNGSSITCGQFENASTCVFPATTSPTNTSGTYENSTVIDHNETLSRAYAEKLTPTGYLIQGIYTTFVGIIATSGNGIVITTIVKSKPLRRKPQVLLLLNLAISDLLIFFFGYPFSAASGYAGKWLTGYVGCQIYGFMCFFLSMSSMNTLVLISCYRYVHVCRYSQAYRLNNNVTLKAIIVAWIYALLVTVPPLMGWSSYTYEQFGTSCSTNWGGKLPTDVSYNTFIIFTCFILHLAIMIPCYIKISVKAFSLSYPRDPVTLPQNTRHFASRIFAHLRVKKEIRTSLVCGLMVGTFTVVWTPYAVLSVVHLFMHVPVEFSTFPTLFAKSSCMMNPLIYFCTNRRFRNYVRQVLCRYLLRRIEPDDTFNAKNRYIASYNVKSSHMSICVDTSYTRDGIFTGRRKHCWEDFVQAKEESSHPCNPVFTTSEHPIASTSASQAYAIGRQNNCHLIDLEEASSMNSRKYLNSIHNSLHQHAHREAARHLSPVDRPSGATSLSDVQVHSSSSFVTTNINHVFSPGKRVRLPPIKPKSTKQKLIPRDKFDIIEDDFFSIVPHFQKKRNEEGEPEAMSTHDDEDTHKSSFALENKNPPPVESAGDESASKQTETAI
ncbi:unnamed protein product [Owenia fusiformis]|uniref:Uncharacterized protein n=1 Tax=Owenia fusiformis TaxID=6347 RepID=A0A8J1T6G5_OWEFU|nr:unnamed protein product [Owenia fusiformis]